MAYWSEAYESPLPTKLTCCTNLGVLPRRREVFPWGLKSVKSIIKEEIGGICGGVEGRSLVSVPLHPVMNEASNARIRRQGIMTLFVMVFMVPLSLTYH